MKAYAVKRGRETRREGGTPTRSDLVIKYLPVGGSTWKFRKASRVAKEFKIGVEVRTLQDAEKVARAVSRILEDGQRAVDAEGIRPAHDTSITNAVKKFVEWGEAHKRGRTPQEWEHQTRFFTEFCGCQKPPVTMTGEITPSILRDFKTWVATREKRHYNGAKTVVVGGETGAHTRNGTLRVIRRLLSFGDGIGWWKVPLPRLALEVKQEENAHEKPPVTIARERAQALLLGALDVDLKQRERYRSDAGWPSLLFVAVGLCCPTRVNEVLHLSWPDVHFDDDPEQHPHVSIMWKAGDEDEGEDHENDEGDGKVASQVDSDRAEDDRARDEGWETKTGQVRRIPLAHAPQLQELLRVCRDQAANSPLAEARRWVCCSHQRRARLESVKKAWQFIEKAANEHLAGKSKKVDHIRPKDMRSNATSRLAQWKRDGVPVFALTDVALMAGHSVAVCQRHYLETVKSEGATFEEALGIREAMTKVIAAIQEVTPSRAEAPSSQSERSLARGTRQRPTPK